MAFSFSVPSMAANCSQAVRNGRISGVAEARFAQHAPTRTPDSTDFETVLECASAAGIVAGIHSGLGLAILNERQVTPTQVVEEQFAHPPGVTYVVRLARRARNPATETLMKEIDREVGRDRRLRIA